MTAFFDWALVVVAGLAFWLLALHWLSS